MKQITQDYLKSVLNYDPDTGFFTWKERVREHFSSEREWKRWNRKHAGKPAGGHTAITLTPFGAYLPHRLAFLYVYGSMPNGPVTRVNGLKADNRIANLRDVSPSENPRNRKMSRRNTSGITGVRWAKKDKAWRAYISTEGGQVQLGSFNNLFDAAAARKSAELEHGYSPRHGRANA